MLKFSEVQLAQLDRLEKHQYVVEVRQNILTQYPSLVDRAGLDERLEKAYGQAVELGFVNGSSITQFLYYEAFAPCFYREPAIHAWLSKPGQSVEQRFSDLNAKLKSKLKGF
ncbi:hypothetical protein GTP58_23360 [Duganella sp. CY15W]|uniref:hypothetical protein n=1 Tax=Duganella sp. CY15W TaxID=2692172 RepID=UPI00136E0A62|nr:hypothetical protein [Duganella sp. CY15W]MYM31282.1 hypothetical protein [Duganella sp. CY15W]